jgi:hypothetical protein
MPGAKLLVLNRVFVPIRECGPHGIRPMPDNQHNPTRACARHSAGHQFDNWQPANFMEPFRQLGLHPSALARGENDGSDAFVHCRLF